jgi:hypothetical protein
MKAFEHFVADFDAPIVARLRAAVLRRMLNIADSLADDAV